MDSGSACNIETNIHRVLEWLRIEGVSRIADAPILPDRIFCWDTLGELRRHIEKHPEHWSHDKWDPLHGKSERNSWRERTKPSMQVCEHVISQINHPNLPFPIYYELDLDQAPPSSFLGFLDHSKEVLENLALQRTTDQDDMSKRLDDRLKV